MRLITLIVLSLLCAITHAHAASYVVEDLGALPGHLGSKARSINDQGWIVALSSPKGKKVGTKVNVGYPFLWKDGHIQAIGAKEGYPSSITKGGRIAINSPGGAYVVIGDKITNLKTVAGYKECSVHDTNDSGASVGACEKDDSTVQLPVIWSADGTPTAIDLPIRSSFGYAVGVNTAGDIVGYAETTEGKPVAFLRRAGKVTVINTAESKATLMPWDINDSGSVVGMTMDSRGGMAGFVWTNGKFTSLKLPADRTGGFAVALNNQGQMVGWTFDSKRNRRACVWTGEVPTELPTPTGGRSEAWDINDTGVVVGYQEDSQGVQRAVRWKQVP